MLKHEFIEYLDDYNSLASDMKLFVGNGVDVSKLRLIADDLTEHCINSVITWFQDGGKLTKWYSKWSDYEGNWYYTLKKGLVELCVGTKKVILKKERKKRKDWIDTLATHWANDAKESRDKAMEDKLVMLGRKLSWHNKTLLPYVEGLFGEAISDK